MTVEELLSKVNEKIDTTKFTSLSSKTIDEELNDVLDEIGDDEESNDKIITKLANRLKRMDGNLHKNVSSEIKKAKEEAERRKAEEEERKRKEKEDKDNKPEDDKYQKLLDEIESLKKANARRDLEAARKATIESVKAGLKEKFDKAGLEMNDFFLDTALSKIEIPESDADVTGLVSKAEGIYTADYKRANGGNAIPRKGLGTSHEEKRVDEHEWDDIKEAYKGRAPKGSVRK